MHFNSFPTSEVCSQYILSPLGKPDLLGDDRNPAEYPTREVYSHDRATPVAAEEAALPLESAVGEDVLVFVAGQQTEIERRVVRGQFLVGRRADLRLDPNLEPEPGPNGVDGEPHHLVLVGADNLPGPRRVKRDGLWIAVDESEVVLKRPAADRLIEGDAIRASVGQRDDREVALRDDEQLGELAVGRPVVPDGAHAVHVAQEPTEANGVAQGARSQLSRGFLHLMQHVGGEYSDTACCAPVTHMEPGPEQQVCHRGCDAPARIVAARMPPRSRNGQEPILAAVVSYSEPPGHDVIAREETVREPQRRADDRTHALLEGLARHRLDD